MTAAGHGGTLRVDALLERAARTTPGRKAVVVGEITWTYAQVHERACRLANALAALGVRKGDRVALWAGNRAEFLEFIFGVPKLGALASPLDYWWTWTDAEAALEQIRPRVVIAGAAQAAEMAAHREQLAAAGIEQVLCLDETPQGRPFAS